jgi:hypothetical protein
MPFQIDCSGKMLDGLEGYHQEAMTWTAGDQIQSSLILSFLESATDFEERPL